MIDLPTLLIVTVFATALSGALLVYVWLTNRHTPALVLWAIGYLMAATALALILAREKIADTWSIDFANTLAITAYGIIWAGARQFDNRRTPLAYILIGPAIWLLARHFDTYFASMTANVGLVSVLLFCYTALTGYEFWRGSRKLYSGWLLIMVIGIHAALFLSRVFWPDWILHALTGSQPVMSVFVVSGFELLFSSFYMPFLFAFVVKERREQFYRRESLIDPLTGIANRRAFLVGASRQLQRAAIDGQTVAFIAFDLDRFKTINDSYGHSAGDHILRAVCDVVTKTLRPGDLFGRIGGEEFACLLADITPVGAAAAAERLRNQIANLEVEFAATQLSVTASLGVAIARQPRPDLDALMAAADRALYQAKEFGRNRVELAKLSIGTPDRDSPASHHVRTRGQ
jgi:diguanylate cyclase (GGDEF)-like protein